MSSFICTIAALKASNNNISNPSLSETVQNLARSFENHFLAHSVIALPGYMLKNTKLESVFDLSVFNIDRIQNFRMKKLCDELSLYRHVSDSFLPAERFRVDPVCNSVAERIFIIKQTLHWVPGCTKTSNKKKNQFANVQFICTIADLKARDNNISNIQAFRKPLKILQDHLRTIVWRIPLQLCLVKW